MSKVHGLVVGINDFEGTQNDLSGCVNDALDINRLLSTEHLSGSPIDQLPFFHNADSVTILLDQQAKLAQALSAVNTLLSKLGDDDLGFLWFSQHGTYVKDKNGDEPDGNDEALVFQDFGLWIDDNIYKTLSKRNPKSRLFLGTDACHSGTVHRMYSPVGRLVNRRVRYMPADHFPIGKRPEVAPLRQRGVFVKRQDPLPNVIHMAGCQDIEYCFDASFRQRPNGAFTYYLLKALSTLKPGAVYGDWFKAVGGFLPSVEYPQQPRCNAKPECLAWPIPLRKG